MPWVAAAATVPTTIVVIALDQAALLPASSIFFYDRNYLFFMLMIFNTFIFLNLNKVKTQLAFPFVPIGKPKLRHVDFASIKNSLIFNSSAFSGNARVKMKRNG